MLRVENKRIDLDALPRIFQVPVAWHLKYGAWQYDEGNLDEGSLYLHGGQVKEDSSGRLPSVLGHTLWSGYAETPCPGMALTMARRTNAANATLLEWFHAHPELVPTSWRGKNVTFWGTLFWVERELHVATLNVRKDGVLVPHLQSLNSYWYGDSPALILPWRQESEWV